MFRRVLLSIALLIVVVPLALGGWAALELRRAPERCYFAAEPIWNLCRQWLPKPDVSVQARPGAVAAGDRTRYIKGIYVSHYALGSPEHLARVKELLETTELNAVVMDVKGDRGYLVYPTGVPLAREIGADRQVMVRDWAAFMQWFKERDVYTIARIVVFKDHLLATGHPEWAVRDVATGAAWRDGEGLGWGDPYRPEVQDYNIALAVEAARQGFDEIQFDYVRFPSDGAVGRAVFAGPNTATSRSATIAGFLSRAREALAPYGVKLSADIFGYTAWTTGDLGIGQVIEALAPHLDVLSPMLYPSTFAAGLPNDGGTYAKAIAFPYEIVHKSTWRVVWRARTVNPRIEVRPWLQDFPDYAFDRRTYSADEIRAQMEGARTAGARGWLLWDPAVRYTAAALGSAQPAHRPNTAGFVLVLRYREIGRPEGPGQRTPEGLRGDLERLRAAGYYPVTVREMVEERLSAVPAGKRPVVLTFDAATPG
ncbi:MAG: putative glycoside hydrolase [Anaerolineae bacterium]